VVPAMPHNQQRSVSSQLSPGKLRPRMRPRGHSAGEKETAALAAAMWSAAPDRQRDYCSLFVLAVSRTKSERRNRKTAAPRGAAAEPIAGRFAPAPSMGGERRGVCLHRRLGGDGGFGWLGLLLVPFDRLGLARGRARGHLVHARDRDDGEAFLYAVTHLHHTLALLFPAPT